MPTGAQAHALLPNSITIIALDIPPPSALLTYFELLSPRHHPRWRVSRLPAWRRCSRVCHPPRQHYLVSQPPVHGPSPDSEPWRRFRRRRSRNPTYHRPLTLSILGLQVEGPIQLSKGGPRPPHQLLLFSPRTGRKTTARTRSMVSVGPATPKTARHWTCCGSMPSM